ncbi:MAG: TonB-dependent receptor [Tannerellaceae bacterium]|nr:TonB-dependent receptor [Tannerellaceae bacterium]
MDRMIFFKRITYPVIAVLLCNMDVLAADTLVVVKGYVYDAAGRLPLANVNITGANTRTGTSTDANGFFNIRLPAKTLRLRIMHVGYADKTIPVAGYEPDSLLRIMLTGSDIQLGEVNVAVSIPSVLNTSRMGVVSFSQEAVKKIPALFGEADVMKALQTQPGVSAGSARLSGMYVRGGNEDGNLYMLDDIPVYGMMHLGGLFSAINVEAVKDVTFYKSSFPSRYGGRLSSVLNVNTREGDMFAYHGSLMLGLTSANVNIDGPVIKGKTSFAASFRRSWLEALSAPGLAVIKEQRGKNIWKIRLRRCKSKAEPSVQ